MRVLMGHIEERLDEEEEDDEDDDYDDDGEDGEDGLDPLETSNFHHPKDIEYHKDYPPFWKIDCGKEGEVHIFKREIQVRFDKKEESPN